MSQIKVLCVGFLALLIITSVQSGYGQEPANINTQQLMNKINESRGQVVILNFWASWCSACAGKLQDMTRLHGQFSDEQLKILGVSMDEDPQTMQKFLESHDVNYDNYQGDSSVAQAFGVTGVPKTYVYDSQGELELKEFGSIDYGRLQNIVQELLQE